MGVETVETPQDEDALGVEYALGGAAYAQQHRRFHMRASQQASNRLMETPQPALRA